MQCLLSSCALDCDVRMEDGRHIRDALIMAPNVNFKEKSVYTSVLSYDYRFGKTLSYKEKYMCFEFSVAKSERMFNLYRLGN